ncbi:acetyl/propionyl/methylcrotonyl-CoA carboxylase subunit alpha [Kineococcus arenarius]|uniref:acetyl/propionyl/methylcrotonyl-CoA carboxylase subunit alpha n=1 Tax=unclassified Kineococcus TaxID=2621656 RepID=UPI003D7E56DE
MSTTRIRKVLVANRGEIALRVLRGARDTGVVGVAVYADPDADSPHVSAADEAFALGGSTAAETYLDADKLIDAARRCGADAVHPGYGFLSENADFARKVLDAGLTWIGPPPRAIELLGDKVSARRIAQETGAPLVPGTAQPVAGVDEVLAFAREHGLPIAVKAAHGGGGRGLKVARTLQEVPELFASATREALTAFGRGECFVERWLDRPRHVEAQVLADDHGNVTVVGTRDCSLQRRFQKLVEEAPAPFLTDSQRERITESARAVCRAVGYRGAGTVEFLIGEDGTITFLEVNTRLQVEHPVTEEAYGVDLVAEQLRVAEGHRLPFAHDPEPRAHSIEFRLNAEDPARGFLPAPGTVTRWEPPGGPGVRVDAGVRLGNPVGGTFDSLLAKLVVTGGTREQALARARRALAEFTVEGVPTVLPFHRSVVDDPAFTATDGFTVHTRWIETQWSGRGAGQPQGSAAPEPPGERRTLVLEVDGRRVSVTLPADELAAPADRPRSRRGERRRGTAPTEPGAVPAPMDGTVVRVAVEQGAEVQRGDLLAVLEAMKMETPVTAPRAGTVRQVRVEAGGSVVQGAPLLTLE